MRQNAKTCFIKANRTTDARNTGNNSGPTAASYTDHVTPNSIKLAVLQISTFLGDYTEWSSYFDIFTALVHNNNSSLGRFSVAISA